jgi:hypothetical protein
MQAASKGPRPLARAKNGAKNSLSGFSGSRKRRVVSYRNAMRRTPISVAIISPTPNREAGAFASAPSESSALPMFSVTGSL